MKKLMTIFCIFGVFQFGGVYASDDYLEGDEGLACEAILCLSTGQPPHECSPSLERYFSISYKKFSKTLTERRKFLDLCPEASDDPEMVALVDAITDGAERCDAKSLNKDLVRSRRVRTCDPKLVVGVGCGYTMIKVIIDQLPDYCTAYFDHEYTRISAPHYVGIVEDGGHWVD